MKKVTLGEIAEIQRKIVNPEDIEPGTLYVGLENLGGDGKISNVTPVQSGDLASSKFSFGPQHILYGKLRPYLRKIARPEIAGVCSTDILPILPNANVDRDYIYYCLRHDSLVSKATSLAVGINLPRLSPEALKRFAIPLPALSEQRRIAAILDQAGTLRAMRSYSIQKTSDWMCSVFLRSFGHPGVGPFKFPLAKLGEIGEWKSGGTPPRPKTAFFDGTIPWFSSGELESMRVRDSREHISAVALQQTSAKSVPAGALMLGMYDTAALKASIATVDCACNQAIAFSAIPPGKANAVYVYFAITIGRAIFRRLQRGVRQKNLNLEMIRDIKIPLPPISQQNAFADLVSKAEDLICKSTASLKYLDALFQSLQHRAFRGEL